MTDHELVREVLAAGEAYLIALAASIGAAARRSETSQAGREQALAERRKLLVDTIAALVERAEGRTR